jgi:hypothetical protein
MKKKPDTSANIELRRQAETRLSQFEKKTVKELPKTNADLQRLVHELQVHQIELEMQNEELIQTRMQLERTLEMYVGLYTLARVGYFTLARDSTVRSSNFMGAKLVGVELSALVGQRFDIFISPEGRITFRAFLDKLFTTGNKAVCEIFLQKDWSARMAVHIVGACDTLSGQVGVCYIIVSEITEPQKFDMAY